MSTAATPLPQTASIMVGLFDGARRPLTETEILLRIIDGNQEPLQPHQGRGSHFLLHVPFHDNLFDNYTVIAWAKGYKQAGFTPVKVTPKVLQPLDLMLLPEDGVIKAARWEDLNEQYPEIADLLATEAIDDQAAQRRYDDFREDRPEELAAFFNLTTAMNDIHLPVGTPLTYIKTLMWETLQPDRFFAWADAALVDQVRIAAAQGLFMPEIGSGFMHPGATSSYKQLQFGEANVQLTFHENDRRVIDGVDCIKIEPDIDYFRDRLAHALLEVVPNRITGSITDPRAVYVLRWIAGRHAGVPEFDPPYTIEAA